MTTTQNPAKLAGEQNASAAEIILDPSGNTYCGALAQPFATGRLELPDMSKLRQDWFYVFEVTDKGEVIQRAGQSSMLGASSYMSPDRVLVYFRNPLPADVILSTGRRVIHSRMANGATAADIEGEHPEMTQAEWEEYGQLRARAEMKRKAERKARDKAAVGAGVLHFEPLTSYRVTAKDGTSHVTSMAAGITLEEARSYFVGQTVEVAL